jgi:uncharacterized damage-inducible protein DinB
MNKQDIQLLFDYNRWCNARILGAAAQLTAEQFLAPGTFPHGGLRGTLVHALFAEWLWRMRWQGTPPGYGYRLQPEEFPTCAALQARWLGEDTSLMEFVAGLTDEKLKSELEYTSTEGGRQGAFMGTLAHPSITHAPHGSRSDPYGPRPLARRYRSIVFPTRHRTLGWGGRD